MRDGLLALVRFARRAASADLAIAYEAAADGLAVPLAADPGPVPKPFSLASTRIAAVDWTAAPVPAEPLHLPSAVLLGLDRPVGDALFVATPIDEAPRSGLLILWASNAPWQCECPFRSGIQDGIASLAPVFGQMLRDRRAILNRRLTNDRFRDLFDSVSTGIVILEGNGLSGLVNDVAAALLGIPAGELEAFEIAGPMRDIRARCRNADELSEIYAPLQRNASYAVTTIWDLGDRQIEVDTHPILGNGRNGRIWLFDDVTARRMVEDNLRRLAITDPLTGLSNRRAFFERGDAVLAGASDRPGPSSEKPAPAVLMLDIDHFKSINDVHGHHAGDDVLQAVAARLRGALREQDLVARLGGEEFAALFDGLSRDAVLSAAERLRATVAETPVATEVAAVEVRVSVGVAIRDGDEETLAAMLERADRALYEAKRSGRDRVVVAGGRS